MRFRLEPDYDNPTLWNVWDRKKETFVAIGVGQQDAWAIAVLLERDSKSSSENDGGVPAEIYPVTKSTDPQDRTVESQFWCPFGQHRTIYEVRVLPGFELTARCHDCFALSPLSVISHRWSEWLPSHPDIPSVGVVDRHVDALADTPAPPSADFLLGSE